MKKAAKEGLRGRGAAENPPNRFAPMWVEPEEGEGPEAQRTQCFQDDSRSILTTNKSPDLGMHTSLNPYRGCEHGCVYCYARPTHEYLGFSAGLDFETKIVVKHKAPALLHKALSSPRWKPKAIAMSSATDPYQPIERKLQLTHQCLEVLADFRNPVTVITKNALILRDLDLLRSLARHDAVRVCLSITTLDASLAHKMEPRAATPAKRLAAVETLAQAGISVGVLVAPIISGLNDHEIPAILEAAAQHGASFAGYTVVRLPYGVKDLFCSWLERHLPLRKDKILKRIKDMRGGDLNDSTFGTRMRGQGPYAEQIASLFGLFSQKFDLHHKQPPLNTDAFQQPTPQLSLFADLPPA